MKILIGLIGLIGIHLLILKNIQFTAWPEMFSYPYLLNHGFTLYKDQALPYQPLLVLFLSKIYAIWGYDLNVLEIFTWAIILINDLLIFIISGKIIGNKILSFFPLIFYVLVQGIAGGNMLWFDLGTIPFILGATYSLIAFNSAKKYFITGVLLGLAAATKQQMLIVPVAVIIYWLAKKNLAGIWRFAVGFLVPWFLIFLWVLSQGIFHDYIFWTTVVPFFWYPQFPGYVNWPTDFQILQIVMLFSGIFLVIKNFKKWGETAWILFLTFVALFLTAFPRFDYFRMQPSLALFPLFWATMLDKGKACVLVLSAFLFVSISIHNISFQKEARFWDTNALKLSNSIKQYLNEGDRTYFLGVPSQQYILTNTYPLKPWVDNYIWYMEIPGIQDKVINGFENDKPRYVFWQPPQRGQWFEIGTYQPQKVTSYIKEKYKKVDIIEGVELWQRN